MILFDSMRKALGKAEALPTLSDYHKNKAAKISEDESKISYLESLNNYIMDALEDPDDWETAETLLGTDWQETVTFGKAISYVDRWLDDNSLDLGQEAANLLQENRRSPHSQSAKKGGFVRGNRHKFERCPIAGQFYYRVVLDAWLEENVRPRAQPLESKVA